MDEQTLERLLRRYSGLCRSKRILVKPNIPRLKMLDAIGQFAHEVQLESSILMLYDDTFFRNCSNGILIAKDSMYGRGRGSTRFSWDFLNERELELSGNQLYIDNVFVMSFRYLTRLERENILSFARDVQALYLNRPVPSLERRRPGKSPEAASAALPEDLFGLESHEGRKGQDREARIAQEAREARGGQGGQKGQKGQEGSEGQDGGRVPGDPVSPGGGEDSERPDGAGDAEDHGDHEAQEPSEVSDVTEIPRD
jgi:hypothetical protein